MNKNIELTNRELNKRIEARMSRIEGKVTAAKIMKMFPLEEVDGEYIKAYVKSTQTETLQTRCQGTTMVRGYRN